MSNRTKNYLKIWGVSLVVALSGAGLATLEYTTVGSGLLLLGLVVLGVSWFLWYWDIV